MAETEDNEFTVRDRRIDHDDPSPVAPPDADGAAASGGDTGEVDADAGAATPGDGFSMADQAPAIDFTAFAFSLAQWALIFMGLEPHPEGGQATVNLEAARQNIDILAMLEEKTRGNLTAEEAEFIAKLLYTLRMGFVEVSKGHPAD